MYRAKTVKNVVVVNEELSAEQWKRRYEKEHERVARLKGQLARAQNELERWRRGEQVSVDEQVNLKIDFLDNEPGLSSSASFLSLSSIPISLSSNALLNQTVTLSGNAADATFAVSVPSDWEKERMVLYAQLDEKDDELNNASQTIETLKMNLAEQDELIKQLRKENDDLQNRIGALETDNEMRKDELKEIMKAFEELAMNFDLKQQESDTTRSENETLLQELDKKAISLKQIENELDLYKDNMNSQRKRIFDMMFTLLKDLSEISGVVGGGAVTDFKVGFETITAFCFLHDLIKTICVWFSKRANLENIDNAEEEFTMARLFVGKLKAEIKVLTQVRHHFVDSCILWISSSIASVFKYVSYMRLLKNSDSGLRLEYVGLLFYFKPTSSIESNLNIVKNNWKKEVYFHQQHGRIICQFIFIIL